MGKALWYIASPRSLKPFHDWASKVDYVDKLIVKNHMHHEAQEIAMSFFFERKYDYFIISSDDLVGEVNHIKLLIENEEKHKFPVISGWMHYLVGRRKAANVTMEPVKDIKTPEKVRMASYNWVLAKDIIDKKYGYPFFKAWFVGLPLTLIRRDILKKIPLKPFLFQRDIYCTTPETKKKGRGKMFDLQFAINCARAKVPITIDARIALREIQGNLKKGQRRLEVGQNPRVEFIKATR